MKKIYNYLSNFSESIFEDFYKWCQNQKNSDLVIDSIDDTMTGIDFIKELKGIFVLYLCKKNRLKFTPMEYDKFDAIIKYMVDNFNISQNSMMKGIMLGIVYSLASNKDLVKEDYSLLISKLEKLNNKF